jgi:hypothetical protein
VVVFVTTEIPTEAASILAAIQKADLFGCGCCAPSYDYERFESREEALAAAIAEDALPSLRHQWAEQVAQEIHELHMRMQSILPSGPLAEGFEAAITTVREFGETSP